MLFYFFQIGYGGIRYHSQKRQVDTSIRIE